MRWLNAGSVVAVALCVPHLSCGPPAADHDEDAAPVLLGCAELSGPDAVRLAPPLCETCEPLRRISAVVVEPDGCRRIVDPFQGSRGQLDRAAYFLPDVGGYKVAKWHNRWPHRTEMDVFVWAIDREPAAGFVRWFFVGCEGRVEDLGLFADIWAYWPDEYEPRTFGRCGVARPWFSHPNSCYLRGVHAGGYVRRVPAENGYPREHRAFPEPRDDPPCPPCLANVPLMSDRAIADCWSGDGMPVPPQAAIDTP
jgi:hypothetical protein